MNKLCCLVLGIVGLSFAPACAVNAGDESGEQTASNSEAVTVCNSTNGLMPTKAALAVAMANELGRWEPLKDLTVVNGVVALSSSAVCLKNNCAATKAVLGQQNTNLINVINQSLFNPYNYQSDLNQSFNRQSNLIQNLVWNYSSQVPPAHKLTMIHGPTDLGTGACGLHYIFQADHLDGTPLSATEASNLGNDLCYYGYGSGCGGNNFIAYTTTTQGCPWGRTCVAVDPTSGDGGGTSTSGTSTPTSYPMNRMQDLTCGASTCTSGNAGTACYLWGTTTLGTWTNKCASMSNTCGYLYCVKN